MLMPTVRTFLALLILAAPSVFALQSAPYSEKALADARAQGQPVVLHFHASWCGSCKLQTMALDNLAKEKLPGTVLVVDYDQAQALKERFGVRTQSTIIVFKGTKETARLTGETRESRIRAALSTAL